MSEDKSKPMDTSIILRLNETEQGYVLHTHTKELIVIKKGEVQNDLSKRQLNFVKQSIFD